MQSLWKTVWSFLKKLKMELPYDLPSDSTSGTTRIPEEIWGTNLKEYVLPYVHCNVIYNSKDLEAAQVSICR